MDAICIKIDEDILKKIDSLLTANNYSTRTEFIREAIRNKLNEIEKERAIKRLQSLMGSAKAHVSDERLHQIREEIAEEYAKKCGISLN